MPYKVNPTTGQLDYYEEAGSGGGGGATNLNFIPSPNSGTVTSDSGTDANIPLADSINSGLFSPAEKEKLAIALISVGVNYLGQYNNGADYTLGDVVLYNGILYERVSNPNNPGYPPGTPSWGVFDPLIGSPSFDLWIRNILSNKVNTEAGKGLSTEDYTTAEQTKLAGIEAGAEVNVNADWNATSGDAEILNKPTSLPSSFVKHAVKYGQALVKGQAAYVSSSDGTNMIVSKADYSLESTSSKTMGLIITSGATNFQGEILTEGLLAGTGDAPLSTITANAGDPVWLGDDGNLLFGLLNKPVAPNHMVFIGVVTRVHAVNGEIFVKVQNGFELYELHNVDAVNPLNNDGIFYNTTTSLWEHKSISAALGYTPVGGSGTINYVSKFTASGTLGDSALYNTGANTGIGVTSPISPLHISSVNKVVSNTLYTSDYLTVSAEATAPGFNIITSSDTGGHRGVFKSTRSRGTLDAPTAVTSGDQTMSIVAAGHDGTTNLTTAGITFLVDGAVSTNVLPQAITFATGPGNTRIERMRITSAGNVGINTTTPGAALTVRATAVPSTGESIASFQVSDSSATIGIQNTSNADNIFIPSLVANQVAGTGQVALNLTGYIPAADDTGTTPIMTFRSALGTFTTASTRPLFDFRNWSTSVMTIAASGNVGIGTITPSASLHINNIGTGNSFLVEDSANPDTTPFVINNSGSVGIGTDTPTAKLHVSGNGGIANWVGNDHAYHQFFPQGISAGRFAYIGCPSVGSKNFTIFNETVDGNISLGTNNTDRLTISSSGNVGIGSSSPTAKFEIKSSGQNNIGGLLLRATGSSNYPALIYETTNQAGVIELYTGSTLTTRLYADGFSYFNGGNIGIGTAVPTAKLHVNNTTAGSSLLIEDTTNPDTTPFVVDTTGNVGVGTLTPSHKLHVINDTSNILLVERTGSLNAPIQYKNAAGSFYTGLSSDAKFTIGSNSDLANNSTAFLTILPTGQVGIGTNTPTAKLEVNGNVKISTIDNATTDTDKFLVSDSGEVKFRTGSQVLSDIGAQGSITLTTTGTSGAATLVGNTLNIPQYTGGATLSQTLVAGNSAGTTDIDMNNNDITNIDNVSTSSTTLQMQAVLNSALIFYANNC